MQYILNSINSSKTKKKIVSIYNYNLHSATKSKQKKNIYITVQIILHDERWSIKWTMGYIYDDESKTVYKTQTAVRPHQKLIIEKKIPNKTSYIYICSTVYTNNETCANIYTKTKNKKK